jgi:hypothetical protein
MITSVLLYYIVYCIVLYNSGKFSPQFSRLNSGRVYLHLCRDDQQQQATAIILLTWSWREKFERKKVAKIDLFSFYIFYLFLDFIFFIYFWILYFLFVFDFIFFIFLAPPFVNTVASLKGGLHLVFFFVFFIFCSIKLYLV